MIAPNLTTALDLTETVDDTYVDINVQTVDRLAIQTIATDVTPGAKSFVAANVNISVTATGTITVVDYTSLTGKVVTINGIALTEGVEWTAATANADTATSLASAITTATATTLCTASALSAVITVTANTAGTVGNVTVSSDGGAAITVPAALSGGTDVSTITITNHGFVTGLKAPLTGTNLPTGLSATNYWIIKVDANTVRLASSYANAVAGTFVVISGAGTTANAALTPSSFGTATVGLKASLDGVNYFAFASPKTISITGTANAFLDCGQVSYPWARVYLTAQVAGALTLKVLVYGMDTQTHNNA